MRDIRFAVNSTGKATLFRNNVGFDESKKIKYGLGKGSADLVGFIHATGQFLAIEVKTPVGRLSKEQKAFISFVNARGGRAFVARSVTAALSALGMSEEASPA